MQAALKVYYAHAMCLYGTDIEKAELARIKEEFDEYEIVNPGEYGQNPEKSREGMQYCFGLIDQCDALVFSRLLGKVTAGVGLEVSHALSRGIPVSEIQGNGFGKIAKAVPFLSRDETIRHYEFWRRITGRQ